MMINRVSGISAKGRCEADMIGQTHLHGNKGSIRKRLLLTYCWNPNHCCLVAWRGSKNESLHSKDKSTPQPLFPWVPFLMAPPIHYQCTGGAARPITGWLSLALEKDTKQNKHPLRLLLPWTLCKQRQNKVYIGPQLQREREWVWDKFRRKQN